MRLLFALWMCAALSALGAPNAGLDEARRLIDDLELDQALKRLDAVEAAPGNSKETLVELYALRGATLATLGKAKPAEEAFRVVLSLSPDFKLVGDYAPRVRTPFYAAREWAAKNGAVSTRAEASTTAEGAVESLSVVVKDDALKLAARVRFSVRAKGAWRASEVPVVSGRAKLAVAEPSVEWWAEVLTAKGAVLATLGSEASPRVEGARRAATTPPVEPPPPPPPLVSSAAASPPMVEADQPARAPQGWMKVTAFSLLGAGVVAGGLGAALGVSSNAARATFAAAERDSNGLVTGLSRREALALEERSRTEATVANVLFVSAGVLAATGAVLLIVDLQQVKVALLPTAGGVQVAGHF